MEDRERQAGSVALLVLNRAREAGCAREVDPLRQVIADLELRIRARLDPPNELQDQSIAEDERRVALLARRLVNGKGCRWIDEPAKDVEGGRPAGDETAFAAAERQATGDRIEEQGDDAPVETFVQDAFAGAADAGDDELGRFAQQVLGRLVPKERHRQHVHFGSAVPVVHVEQRQEHGFGSSANQRLVADEDLAERACLCCEPAPCGQVHRQVIALQNFVRRGRKCRVPDDAQAAAAAD